MKQLRKGIFFGNTDRKISLHGLTITETDYVHEYVDWHYHELPYFTYLLQGQLLEASRRNSFQCMAGDVLFHNWHDAHYNRKPGGTARGFHVEIDAVWLQQYDISLDKMSGAYLLKDPELMIRMGRLYRESYQHNADLQLGLDEALISVLHGMNDAETRICLQKPTWVTRVEAFIRDRYSSSLTLQMLALEGGIHPVHLCRDFSKYFGCTTTAYIRKIRVEHSLTLLHSRDLSLSSIAYHCGFADQSHFIRAFQAQLG
ncbi:MAG: AraC family transcriptional regulator, partial [Chitinophagaceae bacterium]